MKSKILKIAFVFFFVSCTQFKSGHFVKIKEASAKRFEYGSVIGGKLINEIYFEI